MVPPIKILIIEDDTTIRRILTDILEIEGFETITAVNGRLGIQIAQTHLPTLIICDIVMPIVDGYGVLRALRQNSVTAPIPFIFLTGNALAANREELMNGADDYLIKPIIVSELLKAIAEQLQKQTDVRRSADDSFNAFHLDGLDRYYTHQEEAAKSPLTSGVPIVPRYTE